MDTVETILAYLEETYRPEAVIVYGSFADGSAGEGSDFDALVIADAPKAHDAGVIGATVLDVFVYPPESVQGAIDPEEFLQVFDGRIVTDKNGTAARLKAVVTDYIARRPRKTGEELRQEVDWCVKMLSRTERGDAEGFFRWHWLLHDSLEIYCDEKGLPYFGPKKALRRMAEADPAAYRLYEKALRELNRDALADWIAAMKELLPEEGSL